MGRNRLRSKAIHHGRAIGKRLVAELINNESDFNVRFRFRIVVVRKRGG